MNLLRLSVVFSYLFFAFAEESDKRSLILSPISRLAFRQKRSLLLPNYGSIKLTIGLGKALIGNNPKGLSLSYELCSYFAGPTVVSDLFNTLKPKLKDMNKSSINKNLTTIENKGWTKSYPYLMKSNVLNPAISYYHKQPFKNKFRPIKYKLRRAIASDGNVPEMEIISLNKGNPLREILENVLGTDARCEVLKTICGSTELLLPPGYSMLQDIIRIVIFGRMIDSTSDGNNNLCEEILTDCGKYAF